MWFFINLISKVKRPRRSHSKKEITEIVYNKGLILKFLHYPNYIPNAIGMYSVFRCRTTTQQKDPFLLIDKLVVRNANPLADETPCFCRFKHIHNG